LRKRWKRVKAADARRETEWNALSEEEKKRRFEGYDEAFLERISENPFSSDMLCDDDSEEEED